MANIGSFFVELGLKKEKFDQGMKEAEQAPSKLNQSFKNLAVGIASAFSVTAILAFGKAAISAYDQQAKNEAALLLALKGRKDIQQVLIDQASELQSKTLFGDEETLNAQKQLAVLGLTKKQIVDLIPLIQDYSTVTGQDLNSAAMLVAKSIATGTNALARYGVEIDSTMSKTEKAAEVVRIFSERYGGQAAKAAEVGTGAMKQAGMAFGDFSEVVGGVISQALSPWFKEVTADIAEMNNVLNSDAIPTWQKLYGLINVQVGYTNKIQAEAARRFQEDHDKEKNLRLENIDLIRQQTDEQIANIDTLKASNAEKIAALKLQAADDYAKKLKEQAAEATKAAEALKKYNENLESIRASLVDIGANDQIFDKLFPGTDQLVSFDDIGEIQPLEIPINIEKFNEQLQSVKDNWSQFQGDMAGMVADFTADVLGTFFEGLGEAIAGGNMQDTLNNIIGLFGDFIGQLGKMMIAYGTSALLFSVLSKSPNPATAIALIAAGAAMAAIGGAIKQSMSKGVGSTGGMSGVGGTAEGGGAVAGSSQLDWQLVTNVSGQDLQFILEKANRTSNRSM